MTTQTEAFFGKHWHVVVYVLGLVFLTGIFYSSVLAMDEKVDENTAAIEKEEETVEEIEKKVVEIDTNLKNVEKEVRENSDKLDEILRRLPRE